MDQLPQELVDKIIDNVDRKDLPVCSFVETRWTDSCHRRIMGTGHCVFRSQPDLLPWRTSLLFLNYSSTLGRVHTLTLSSSALDGWKSCFDSVDVIFPNLKTLVVISPPSRFGGYLPVLEKHFGRTLETLVLCMITFVPGDLFAILASFPNLHDFMISQSPSIAPTMREYLFFFKPPPGLTRGKLSLVGFEAQEGYIPSFMILPEIQYRSLYFSDASQLDIGNVHRLVSACSSTLETLEIRDGQPTTARLRGGGAMVSKDYPELHSIRYILPDIQTSRESVNKMLSSILSAPKFSEITFHFVEAELEEELDRSGLVEWESIDTELCRLAKQAVGEVTAVFDFITKPEWVPTRDAARMKSMSKFRRSGVMIVRSSGEEVAVFRS